MSTSITIRRVSERTHAALVRRAAGRGQSLQEYLLAELDTLADQPSVDEWLVRARQIARRAEPVAVPRVLNDIDADRR